MDIFSLIISGLLAAAMAYFIVMMAVRIGGNVVNGVAYREALAQELDRLRISRMLAALGISMEQYTHQQSVLDIKEQMKSCESCDNTATCDDNLSSGEITPENIDFCANADSMRDMHSKLGQQT